VHKMNGYPPSPRLRRANFSFQLLGSPNVALAKLGRGARTRTVKSSFGDCCDNHFTTPLKFGQVPYIVADCE
jgi:hypothetical protein